MTTLLPRTLAAAPVRFEPLFGSQWLALLAILAGIALFMVAIAAFGRWLALGHPDEPALPLPVAPSVEVYAAISAAVALTCGNRARIASVRPAAVVVDPGHLQWGAEGRRQIYSSHKVR